MGELRALGELPVGLPPRVYVETSVYGGVFDREFAGPSRKLFDQVVAGQIELVTSVVVRSEVELGPPAVLRFFDKMLQHAELARVTEPALRLRDAYVTAGILSARWNRDALHVALAAISGCSMLASWNFRHIVHYRKIPLYNAVNEVNGYGRIAIHSPSEVIGYEEEV